MLRSDHASLWAALGAVPRARFPTLDDDPSRVAGAGMPDAGGADRAGASRSAPRGAPASVRSVAILVLTLLVLTGCGRSELSRADAQVRDAWREVEHCYAHRLAVAAAALALMRDAPDTDPRLLASATSAIDRASRQPPHVAWRGDLRAFDQFKQAHAELTLTLFRLLSAGQQRAELARTHQMRAVREELSTGPSALNAARQRYSFAVTQYNRIVTTFPTSVTAWLLDMPERGDFARLREH